jgi:hypothetical protein
MRPLSPGKSIDITSGSALPYVSFVKELFGLFTNILRPLQKLFSQIKKHLTAVFVEQDDSLSK